jgi:hypothetical protein
MIILDTNVVSEPMRPRPDRGVLAWLDSLPAESAWLTTITVLEMRLGIELLPHGRRRAALSDRFQLLLETAFEGRILPFDVPSAYAAAAIEAAQRHAGRALDGRDAQIAGIAAARKAMIATRNLRDFEGLGLPLIDPWAA